MTEPRRRRFLEASAQVYRLLLRLYPAAFRDRFGDDMVLLFRERLGDEAASGGLRAVLFCIGSLRDVVRNGIAERRSVIPIARARPRAPRIRGDFLPDAAREVRFAVRRAIQSPGHALTTLLTLALGIGANAALFSVVNGVLLRPLSYPDPDRLVRIWDRAPRGTADFLAVTAHNFFKWQEQQDIFEAVGAYRETGLNLFLDGEPERVEGLRVTASLLDVLAVEPSLGRRFSPSEDQPGQDRVAILTHGLWERHFGSDPSVLGRALAIDGESFEIVGIMPEAFSVPQQPRAELMIPLPLPDDPGRPHFLRVLGRLRAGVAVSDARGRLEEAAEQLAMESPAQRGWSITLLPLQEATVSRVESLLLMLMVAVGVLLLLACVNVANLSLARRSRSEQEIAVRSALGASRIRLVRELLLESLVYACAGGALALAVGWATLRALMPLSRTFLPRHAEVHLDSSVFLFTAAIALASGLLSGVLPALRLSRVRTARGATAGKSRRRIQRLLTVVEVGIALMLLVAAGLLARSFVALSSVDPGFRVERALSLDVASLQFRYPDDPARARLFRSILESIAATPGVESAGAAHRGPIGGGMSFYPYWVEGRPEPPPDEVPAVSFKAMSPGYFAALGVPVLQGRDFTSDEAWERGGAVILNQTMAQELWPGEDPLGKRLRVSRTANWLQVVGVVRDTREWGLDEDIGSAMYLPYIEAPQPGLVFVIRSRTPWTASSELVGRIREAVGRIDPAQPISAVATLEDRLRDLVAGERLGALLMGVFAALALLLAAIGIEGVVACSVAQRTREVGLRMALGARVQDVLFLIVGESMATVAIGVALGVMGALLASETLSSQIFGIAATDPATYVAVSAILAAVALLASLAPATRAARVDPANTLRSE
jgi:putative ABC transport system permease protein